MGRFIVYGERDLKKEMNYKEEYIQQIKTLEIGVVVFSNTVVSTKKCNIKNGNWKRLKSFLSSQVYDAATSYKSLSESSSSEVLLFTDGMPTYSDFVVDIGTPMYIVNSILKANHSQN